MRSESQYFFPGVVGTMPTLRFAYLGLALLSALIQALIAAQALQNHQAGLYMQSVFGIMMSLLMGTVSNIHGVSMRFVQCGTILVGYLWVLNSALLLGSARELGATVLVGQLIFTTYAFAWLRQRTAMFISGVTYLLLWTPRGPMAALDRPALLLTGFAMSLVWFLSQYGWHVYTERNQKEAFAALAYRDYLTGIANRNAGRQVLDRLFSELAGTGSGLCVALCDIDHFKRINDTVGHHRGTTVLIEVAGSCRRSPTAHREAETAKAHRG